MPMVSLQLVLAYVLYCLHFRAVIGYAHRVPISATGSLRTRLVRIGRWMDEVEHLNALDTEDNELYYYNGFYTANITLGTPRMCRRIYALFRKKKLFIHRG